MTELVAKGIDGTMRLAGDMLFIQKRQAFVARGEKALPLTSVTAVQFKPPGLLGGYLQIVLGGSDESKGGAFDAGRDENAIVFSHGQRKAFEAIRDAVNAHLAARGRPQAAAPPATPAIDPVTELERYAALRDKGVITPEDFDAKKRQLLGL